ncbi:cytochrome b [Microvirga tunisiensis]|uniref:Cytochrome b n=2 Tax=Pannonibacter tanglangensis TaxID=2750084 RepID=A0A7X5J7R5_9HYPH|nr:MULTISPECIES: cytochrome b/b6 domain-containing protein [unclassified Pannonibacter]NBN63147.1 cytochrome b [Pannonibacter sp. XCT-34]NBN76711.1 cytochrome b [Pannonibacter sp. XCT-53]
MSRDEASQGQTGLFQPSGLVLRTERHAASLRLLHWLVAVLVLATWPLGLMIQYTHADVKLDFYILHESLGFLVIWLMLLRVGNRLFVRSPAVAAPALERRAATLVHGLLYLLLIIMPVSGFLATNAHGFPLKLFGLVPVWSPIGKSPDIAWTLSAIHAWSAWILLGLLALHLAAALFHHLIRRDTTLYRIL